MQLFVDGLADQAERLGLPVELILVEWNPPADRPPLANALRWQPSDQFHPRIITVPREVHDSLPNANQLPLFQMIAKNVGIRRSRAHFILATNIDILLSDELFGFLKRGLKPNAMYRTDRRDVKAVLDRQPLPRPAECRSLPALRQHGIHGTRYPAGLAADGRGSSGRSLHEFHRMAMAAWDRLVLPKLHTSGCGDFTLTSRDVWTALRGYPEWPIFSWQLDGLPLYQAFAGGVEMINLEDPLVAIHLEHTEGSGWTPAGSRALFERVRRASIPYLSTGQYRKYARRVVRSGRGFHPFNGPEWGFANLALATTNP